MTNEQLYLAIGVPILFNTLLGIVLLTSMNRGLAALDKRIDDLRSEVIGRFEAMEKLFTEKLLRVEQVMDARIKHLEEK